MRSCIRVQWVACGISKLDSGTLSSPLASNRYRVLSVRDWLLAQGACTGSLVGLSEWDAASQTVGQFDVVVIGKLPPGGDQKQVAEWSDRVVREARAARCAGVAVVVDFNDDHLLRGGVGPYWQALAGLASVCVAGTAVMAERLRLFTSAPVRVIGDPVLAPRGAPRVFRRHARSRWRRLLGSGGSTDWLHLLWYGHLVNWPPLLKWAECLLPFGNEQQWRLSVITSENADVQAAVASFNLRAKGRARIELMSWSEEAQRSLLAMCDVVLLPTDPNDPSKAVKTANRLSEAGWSGCAVVASELPSYADFCDGAYITEDPAQALRSYLSNAVEAEERIRRLQHLVNESSTIERIGGLWLEALRAAVEPADAGKNYSPVRVLLLSPALIPTVQIAWLRPLRQLALGGHHSLMLITEADLAWRAKYGAAERGERWLMSEAEAFAPTVIVFCRYGGSFGAQLLEWASTKSIRTIYSIDDDLLDVPATLGARKVAFHMDPRRLANVRQLLEGVDCVDVSRPELASCLSHKGLRLRSVSIRLFCAMATCWPLPMGSHIKVGYFGFDHERDLALVVPALCSLLDDHPEVSVELIVPFQVPAAFEAYGERVVSLPLETDYERFLVMLRQREWSIGLCPLRRDTFNAVKNQNKWIELTSVGACVIASEGSIYDQCCKDESGMLVADDEWLPALERAVASKTFRHAVVGKAQERLRKEFSVALQSEQLDVTLSRMSRTQ